MKPLILFLGNPILKDDKIGLIVGERLREALVSEGCDVEVADKVGLNLIDYLEGRDKVVIVDSVAAPNRRIGEVVELDVSDVRPPSVLSPHYVGLPEALRIMEALDLSPPRKLYVIGIGVSDVYSVSDELSEELKAKLEGVVESVYKKIKEVLGRP